jgi:hypothetical protein
VEDEETLRNIDSVIHKINEEAVTIHDKEGIFLGLAHSLCQAYTYKGQRKIYPAVSRHLNSGFLRAD